MGQSTGAIQIFLTSCIILYLFTKADCYATVKVGRSQVVGQMVSSGNGVVYQYLAIPYAQAPMGEMRFKKPTQRKLFSDLYAALNQPPACLQKSEYYFPWYDYSQPQSENCLYLNIWTPSDANSTNTKAVIYYLPGGGFRFGSIKQQVYNGAPLAGHGDVIVVTANYRLETFGFLTSGTEDAPGNIALYDMLEGLKWVNNNILAFGGDTSRITLAGQGSGATGVALLSISPLAKGLFQRAIMESGSPGYPDKDNTQFNIDISQKVAEGVSCANSTHTIRDNPKEVLKCLRSVSAQNLTDVSSAMQPLSSELFIPQFGDKLLPVDPNTAFQNGDFICNDLLIGNTNDEGSYLLTTQNPSVYGFFGSMNPAINKSLGRSEMKQMLEEFPESDAIIQHYLPPTLPDDDYETIRAQAYSSLGDASVVCPTTFYAEQCAKTGGNVYKYIWNHRPGISVWSPWMGVAHATELYFVFGTPLVSKDYFYSDEVALSKKIIDIWSSFAKNGKPSIPWPEFSQENPQVKVLGPESTDLQDQTGYHEENCNLFRSYFGYQDNNQDQE